MGGEPRTYSLLCGKQIVTIRNYNNIVGMDNRADNKSTIEGHQKDIGWYGVSAGGSCVENWYLTNT